MAEAARRARVPGRVNLIGDHTDYNHGLALPMAIDLATVVELRPDGSNRLELVTDVSDRHAELTTPVDDPLAAAAQAPPWAWLAAAVLAELGTRAGGRLSVTSALPVGAGLSSSAAFCVALAMVLGAPRDALALARLCQRAEARTGASVGLMDPLVAVAAQRDCALLIDFTGPTWRRLQVPRDLEVVVVHSGTQRLLAGSPYRERRRQCEAAARHLGRPLGQSTMEELATLADPLLWRRARHVVTECQRVRSFATALERSDALACGRLLLASHQSLAADFECSTAEVDALVASLAERPGVYGARMTGGGFGGCVVALTRPGALDVGEWPGRAWRVLPDGGAWLSAPGPRKAPAPPLR